MSQTHADAHQTFVQAHGALIHWARLYDAMFSSLLRPTGERMIQLGQIKAGDRVLDAGCGPGSLSLMIKACTGSLGAVYAIDAAREMAALARRKADAAGMDINVQVGQLQTLPFPDGIFDVVLSRLVLHHLPGQLKQRALAEIGRVLKVGGYCVVVDFELPPNPLLRRLVVHLPVARAMWRASSASYVPLFTEAGFTELEVGHTGYPLCTFIRGRAGSVRVARSSRSS